MADINVTLTRHELMRLIRACVDDLGTLENKGLIRRTAERLRTLVAAYEAQATELTD